ncbi:hypothetical protein R3P38DRAFT_2978996, partial [Favolaschia claudopus]
MTSVMWVPALLVLLQSSNVNSLALRTIDSVPTPPRALQTSLCPALLPIPLDSRSAFSHARRSRAPDIYKPLDMYLLKAKIDIRATRVASFLQRIPSPGSHCASMWCTLVPSGGSSGKVWRL